MEYNSSGKSSEKDARMASAFEKYSDVEETAEKDPKKKKRKRRSAPKASKPIIKSEQQKPEQIEKTEDEDKSEKIGLDSLFEQKSDDFVEDTEEDESGGLDAELESSVELPENPEEISDGEIRVISEQIIEAHDSELKQELLGVEPGSDQEAEILSSAMFIDELSERLDSGQELDDSLLDQAVDKVSDELEIPIGDKENEPIELESISPETMAELSDNEIGPDVFDQLEKEPDDELTQVASAALPPRPPVPPTAGFGSTSPAGGFGPGPGVNTLSSSPNVAPAPKAAQESINRRQRGHDLLVGGIVGYLVGRRRGRIKTEERLMPVQKSLEKQVKDLNEKISIREQKIRVMTSEKVAREGEDAKQVIADKLEAKARLKAESKSKTIEPKRPAANVPETITPEIVPAETVIDNTSAKTFEQASTQSPETVSPEIIRETSETAFPPSPTPEVAKVVTKELVREMPEVKLLAVAAKIELGNQNAKQLYEQGRVSKEDLRLVVVEHLTAGGRAERILSERLRPAAGAESIEHLPKEKSGKDMAGSESGSGDVVTPQNNLTQSGGTTTKDQDVSAVADALIAQQAAKDQKQESNVVGWVAIATVATALAVAFLVF